LGGRVTNPFFWLVGGFVISAETEQSALEIRTPATEDARQIWLLVRDSGVLDANSAYLYLLLCRDFEDTCLVAYRGELVVGFVTGYRLPKDPSVLFVWQVGVSPTAKRQGIASKLLVELVERCGDSISAIEATVSPSNVASRRLFESLARKLDVAIVDLPDQGFQEAEFPPGDHEAEPRLRIGPLGKSSLSSEVGS